MSDVLEYAYLRKEVIDDRSGWQELVDTRVRGLEFTGFAASAGGVTRFYDLCGNMVGMDEIPIQSVMIGPVELVAFGWAALARLGIVRAAAAMTTAATTNAIRLAAYLAPMVDKLRIFAIPLGSATTAASQVMQRPTIIAGHHRAIAVINAVFRGRLPASTVVGRINQEPLTAGVLTRLFEQGALGVSRHSFVPQRALDLVNYSTAAGLREGGIIIGQSASTGMQAMTSQSGQSLLRFLQTGMH